MNYPRTEVIETDKGFKPLAAIYALRNELSNSLSHYIPGSQASVANGILLGLRGGIQTSTIEAFSRTGTAHLLAISGLHLSIIMGIILSASIWIAAFMGTIFLLGEYLGRQRSAATALAFAAAFMVGFEPQILWDASFQLSFLAITGLIFIAPLLQAFLKQVVVRIYDISRKGTSLINFVIESSAITISAILATWPIITYNFKIFSFVGLPATFFALLAMPAIIVTSALTSIFGLFASPIASIFGYFAWIALSYLMIIVRIFDIAPYTSTIVDNIHPWQICIYYALLASTIIVIYYWKQCRQALKYVSTKTHQITRSINNSYPQKYKKILMLILPVLILLVWIPIFQLPDNKLHVTILNVGQGDAILVQTPSGQNILIDGGPSPRAISSVLGEKLPFWDRKIDLLASTQPQADHLTGLLEVLNNYDVKLIIEPKIDYDSETYREWQRLVKHKRIPCITVHSGQEIQLGNDISINILHPPLDQLHGTSDDIDNNGLVLHLVLNEISFLFTADIGIDAERFLISQRKAPNSNILKVAHHGSNTSTSSEFVAIVNPEAAVISVGENNKLGLPNFEAMSRLEKQLGTDYIYTTAENGNIEFITDGRRLWIRTSW
jgi:competence protein ComEC